MSDSGGNTSDRRVDTSHSPLVGTEKLTERLYDELRRLAHSKLRNHRRPETLNTTALVHEAYLRLAGTDGPNWQSRSHFLATAAKVMRNVIVDYVRKQNTSKRGEGRRPLSLEDIDLATVQRRGDDLLALDDALNKLAAFDPRGAHIVECRFFAGLTQKEIGEAIGVSERTVRKHWLMSKSWIRQELA